MGGEDKDDVNGYDVHGEAGGAGVGGDPGLPPPVSSLPSFLYRDRDQAWGSSTVNPQPPVGTARGQEARSPRGVGGVGVGGGPGDPDRGAAAAAAERRHSFREYHFMHNTSTNINIQISLSEY